MSGGEPSSIKRLFLCAAVNLCALVREPVFSTIGALSVLYICILL